MKKIINLTLLFILLVYISACAGYKPIFSSNFGRHFQWIWEVLGPHFGGFGMPKGAQNGKGENMKILCFP